MEQDSRRLEVETPTRSERVDSVTGVTERVQFIGGPGERIYSVASLPAGDVIGGVVIAPSLLTDRLRSYRGEVLAARRLAALGFAVQRFDYRGFGHSDGQTGVADVALMSADLSTAIANLEDVVDPGQMTLVGSRYGSLLVANRPPPPAIRRAVLWDPVLSGREYFRAAFRAHMVGRLQRTGSEDAPTSQLEETGSASVLGYTVSRQLVESSDGISLVPAIGLIGASVLWIESASELSAARRQAAETLRSAGVDLTIKQIPNGDPGWFVGVRPLQDEDTVAVLVDWLLREARV